MTQRLMQFVEFRRLLILMLFAHVCAAAVWGSDPPRKPRVRAITAFVSIDPTTYVKQIQDALVMLRKAKSAFEKGGYEVQTIRITTQPFPQYTRGITKAEALEFFKGFDALSKTESFLANVGPAMMNDQDDSAVELLADILLSTDINTSLVIAADDGIHWNAIRAAADLPGKRLVRWCHSLLPADTFMAQPGKTIKQNYGVRTRKAAEMMVAQAGQLRGAARITA